MYAPGTFPCSARSTAGAGTPVIGSLVAADVTRPVIWRCCADAPATPMSVASASVSRGMRVTTKASSEGPTEVTEAARSTPYAAARTATPQGREVAADCDRTCARTHKKPPSARRSAVSATGATGLPPRVHLEGVDGHRREHLVGRYVDDDLAQLAVAPHVDPAMAVLVQQRIQPLPQQLVQNRRCGLHPQVSYRVQPSRGPADEVDVLRGLGVVALSEPRLRPQQDQLLVPDDRNRGDRGRVAQPGQARRMTAQWERRNPRRQLGEGRAAGQGDVG